MKKLFLIFFLALLLVSCADKELLLNKTEQNGYSMKLFMNPSEPLPGNRILLQYRISGHSFLSMEYPSVEERDQWDGLDLLSWEKKSSGAELVLLAKQGGDYSIPSLSFLVHRKEESVELIMPESIIRIPQVAQPDSPMLENSPALSIGTLRGWQWAVLLFLLLFGAGLWVYFHFMRKEKRQKAMALSAQLEGIYKSLTLHESINREDPRYFYLEITRVIRLFLDRIFQLSTLEKTSDEYLPIMMRLPVFKKTEHLWLLTLVERADVVKYAGGAARDLQMEEDLQQTRQVLKSLIQYQKERESYEIT